VLGVSYNESEGGHEHGWPYVVVVLPGWLRVVDVVRAHTALVTATVQWLPPPAPSGCWVSMRLGRVGCGGCWNRWLTAVESVVDLVCGCRHQRKFDASGLDVVHCLLRDCAREAGRLLAATEPRYGLHTDEDALARSFGDQAAAMGDPLKC
jgi:hypothetical protein